MTVRPDQQALLDDYHKTQETEHADPAQFALVARCQISQIYLNDPGQAGLFHNDTGEAVRNPSDIIPVVRPGPSIFPFIYAATAVSSAISDDLQRRPLVQPYLDAVIIYCTALDAYVRKPASVTPKEMDTLWARVTSASSGVDDGIRFVPVRGKDDLIFSIMKINLLNMADEWGRKGQPLPRSATRLS
jgi:hypothetical protein